MLANNRIACWMSDKKLQKINWVEFEESCNNYGFEVFKLDLNKTLESQEPFSVLLHKLTDIIALENQGDFKSSQIMKSVEKYISQHPALIVIDPIPNVRQLLGRYKCYSIIRSTGLHKYEIFTPNFCEITLNDVENIKQQLKRADVKYPFICKPRLGHGSKKAHEMLIIFNEKHLKDCKAPCVTQSFVNHDAVLYKIFVVGQEHYFVERPSLKNFYVCEHDTIYFDSSDVSRATSQSSLSVLDPEDNLRITSRVRPDPNVFQTIVSTLRKAFAMDLLGVDVVIDNSTGKYAIIDVNAYPGYDGFPNFFDVLLQCIRSKFISSKIHRDSQELDKTDECIMYSNSLFNHLP